MTEGSEKGHPPVGNQNISAEKCSCCRRIHSGVCWTWSRVSGLFRFINEKYANSVIAVATVFVALAGIATAVVGFWQWKALSHQGELLQGQLNAMEADQRPWMKIEKIAPNVSPIDPNFGGLRFYRPNSPGFLPLHFLLKNVGRSPAFDVRVGVGQFFGYAQEFDLAKEQREACAALDNAFPQLPMVADNTTFIRVIFPGDELPYDTTALAVTPDQINKFSTGDPGKKGFQLWFYGCIRYIFANSREPHQTSFAYRVSHIVDAQIPGAKAMDVGFKPWENIPADRIYFEARPMTAGVTN